MIGGSSEGPQGAARRELQKALSCPLIAEPLALPAIRRPEIPGPCILGKGAVLLIEDRGSLALARKALWFGVHILSPRVWTRFG